jgi:hypothetical protein
MFSKGAQLTAERIQLWHGPDVAEAAAAYARALTAGFSELRARIFGSIASWRDCWTLQATLAKFHRCSVRTVQRAASNSREHGFLRCAWSKPGEVPPGAKEAVPFKWCHRWIPGRGLAGPARQAAINKARADRIIGKAALRRTYNAPQGQAPSKARTKPRTPPDHLTREQRARWLDEQIAREPSTSDAVTREPEPPDR